MSPFGDAAFTNHPPFTNPSQDSGIVRVDQREQRRLRRNEVMAECDGFRTFLQDLHMLEKELHRSAFARLEEELVRAEGRPAVIPPELLDPKKNSIPAMAKIEKAMLDEYPSELAALFVLIHQKIYQSRILQAFDIQAPAAVREIPDRKDWNWKNLKGYLEQAERFLALQLPEFFSYARVLRQEVEQLGYRLPAQHVADLEKMLKAYAGQAQNGKVHETLVRSKAPTDPRALDRLEQDRRTLFQQKGYAFTTLASYLEELAAPLRREQEQEAEAA